MSIVSRTYLRVPFAEKDEAKALGAKWDYLLRSWYYEGDNSALQERWGEPVSKVDLTAEQAELISLAKKGRNVLVDACIGSGKTTTIQALCDEMGDKKILYLTYNTLLKNDAKEKIVNRNVFVTNYHGFAYSCLSRAGISANSADLIQLFIKHRNALEIPEYDVLVMDEYQDIEQEIAQMLELIKQANPQIQIIAVGDMKQKIYDKTTLNVPKFISSFLGNHKKITFTQCFRLSKRLASNLGKVWNKKITGVNKDCEVLEIKEDSIADFLSAYKPGDILCLGQREGVMSRILNDLESKYPEKFNKSTVYASIRDEDRDNIKPGKDVAIFTTFDSSKGLERKVCVVFDFTDDYWHSRLSKPNTKYEIIRNIFCVAASRGKEKVVFVKSRGKDLVDMKTLGRQSEEDGNNKKPFCISDMFSFKYKEDVEYCYSLLKIRKLKTKDESVIEIKNNDELIDLSPCIGILQEASFFKGYNIDKALKEAVEKRDGIELFPIPANATLEEKVLALTAYSTSYARYAKQVSIPFVSKEELRQIKKRLSTLFSRDEQVQNHCEIDFFGKGEKYKITGNLDVLKDGVVYELKFVSELSHEYFLQCACYAVAGNLKKGILWNVKTNERYSIEIPDRELFLKAVARTITKGQIKNPKILAMKMEQSETKEKTTKPKAKKKQRVEEIDIEFV